MRKAIKNSVFVLSILLFLNILAFIVVFDLIRSNPSLEVNFFDVGQGDTIFIESPKRHQILIDGGPGSTILEKLAGEMPFWDKTIDLIILTHPEYDHMTGLIEVLKRYKVENILWTGVVRETAEAQEWEKLIKEEEAQIKIATAGQKIIMNPGLVIEILHPFEILEGRIFEDSNNTSIVSKLIFGENSFLFSGDIYKSVEKEFLDRGIVIGSDVLKVSHHGSKTSTSEDFLKKVSPEIAVILAGKDNPYGHPHEVVLETLAKCGIKILRTDEQGDIKIISDGTSLKVKK